MTSGGFYSLSEHPIQAERGSNLLQLLPYNGIRQRTGCSIVAVERDDHVMVDLGGNLRFEQDDTIYVCGSQSAIARFEEVF